VQCVPLCSIDAGLLYGVPLSLHSGLEDSIDQYKEMEVLTRVLLRLLQERELGLLLCATKTKKMSSTSDTSRSHDHMLLLMAKEFPPTTMPQTGLLFRYAHANQLLTDAIAAHPCPALEQEIGCQYTQYVERALGTLDCDSFNPLADISEPPIRILKSSVLPLRTGLEVPRTKDVDSVDSYGINGESMVMATASPKAPNGMDSSANVAVSSSKSIDEEALWDDSTGVGSCAVPLSMHEPMEEDSLEATEILEHLLDDMVEKLDL
jgi:hypothetical protein